MSHKLQSLRVSTDKILAKIVAQDSGRAQLRGGSNLQILRSWYEYDSEAELARPRRSLNWNMLLGAVIVVGISASFWTGVGILVARIWK